MAQVRDELDRIDKEVKRKRQEKELKAREQQVAEQHRRMLEERHSVFYSQPPQLSSLTNLSSLYNDSLFASFPSHSSKEGILDLRVPGSSRLSTHSMGTDTLSAPVSDFSMETFPQPEQQQQQQSHSALRDSARQELLDFLNSALPSSSDSLHTAIPNTTSYFSNANIHHSSSSSSLFSPSLTPSSSSSSLFSSLSPSDQHPFANCSDDTAINAKEVLSSMLRSGTDSRQSVIHFRVPESEHLS